MKILVVNNGTKFIKELNYILEKDKKNKIKIIDSKSLTPSSPKEFDKIILTGGSRFSVKNHLDKYTNEINLVRKSRKPILGICLGFEIICATYGEKLNLRIFRERGIKRIKLPLKSRKEKILKGIKSLNVYENHRWSVRETKFLFPLIKSKNQIEMVKHPRKEIYGSQFHPEFKDTKKANKVIENFLKI